MLNHVTRISRYNNYLHDPLSACKECNPPYSATNAIAARADLNPVNSTHPPGIFLGHLCFGATDNKVTTRLDCCYGYLYVLGYIL